MLQNGTNPGLSGASRRQVILVGIMLALVFMHLVSYQPPSHESASHPYRTHKQKLARGAETFPPKRDEAPGGRTLRMAQENWRIENPPEPIFLPASPPPAPVYTADELVRGLSGWANRGAKSLTFKDAEKISHLLRQLAAKGEKAVLDIREFLGTGKDLDFDALHASDHIGYPTLRLALLDLLHRLTENTWDIDVGRIFLEVLHTTGNPLEVTTLAGYLEAMAPGYYRSDVLAAARNLMAIASENGVNGHDAGPLFQVFQQYGDDETLAALEGSNPLWWGRYTAIALANLPEGKGIPGLIKSLQSVRSPTADPHARFALDMLAQVAAMYPDAQMPIIEAIRANAIPDSAWPEFAAKVAGLNQVQIGKPAGSARAGAEQISISFAQGGTQVFYQLRNSAADLPPEQLGQRLEFIDRLVSATSNPVGIQALEQMRTRLLSGTGSMSMTSR